MQPQQTPHRRPSRTVLITGASSGIGEALALRYAAQGAHLALIGRNAGRLDDVAARCRAAGAQGVLTARIDVRASLELAQWVSDIDASHPIDLLIASAGLTGGTTPDGRLESPDDSRLLLETNILGVTNAVQAVLPGMLARQSGQIGLLSSLAAFVPLADSPSYCASKAAVLHYALSMREALEPHHIGVSAVCPGYIDTPMARRLTGPKHSLISPDRAAEAILHGLAKNKRIIAFPRGIAFSTRLLACLPARFTRWASPAFRVLPSSMDDA